jgi:hypothetical protein
MFTTDSTIGKNPAIEERRLGKFLYTHEFLVNTPPQAIRNIFMKVIPVNVEFDYARQCFNIVAFSECFEPIELGEQVPDYQLTVRVVDWDGKSVGKSNGRVSVKKKLKKVAYYISFKQIESNPLADLFSSS